MAIFTAASKNVTVENVTVKDAATWAVVNMEVDHLIVRSITVSTDLGPTHDGIDVVDGHDVLIDDVTVTSGDDSICLKSGSARGLENVVVRGSRTKQSGVANGVKLGTASVGSFKNILVEDVAIANAQSAAMAVESVDGAQIANVTFRRITTDNVGTPFFVLLGNRDRDPTHVGSIDGLAFEDITARNMRYAWGSVITGTTIGDQTFGISNVSFKNLDLTFMGAGSPSSPAPFTVDSFPEYQGRVPGQPGKLYNRYPDAKFIAGIDSENITYHAPGWALFLRHVNNVTFTNCKTTVSKADPRPWLGTKDASSITGTCGP
jgi:polygalacturonase